MSEIMILPPKAWDFTGLGLS